MSCRHYFVEGRVQGVFFRASTQDQAQQLGLKGWVRNCNDGRVELQACGEESHLLTLELWLQQGPPMAKVRSLIKEDCEPDEIFRDFEIR